MKFIATIDGQPYSVEVEPGTHTVTVEGKRHNIDLARARGDWLYSLLVDGRSYQVARLEGELEVEGRAFAVEIERDLGLGARASDSAVAGPARLRAPIPGLVVAVHVNPGDEVHEGQALVVLEAMKMQMELKSPRAGHVADVALEPGQEATQGQVLLIVGD
ncbi:MAG TPA: biotin/lipoyl-containing protein [Chloroflexota bacterium]